MLRARSIEAMKTILKARDLSGEAITKFQDGTEPLPMDGASFDFLKMKYIFEQG